jgi:transposase
MAYSSDVTDKEWEIIEPLLPTKKKTRPPVWTKRQILNGIFYQLKNGCNWADLPREFLMRYIFIYVSFSHKLCFKDMSNYFLQTVGEIILAD